MVWYTAAAAASIEIGRLRDILLAISDETVVVSRKYKLPEVATAAVAVVAVAVILLLLLLIMMMMMVLISQING